MRLVSWNVNGIRAVLRKELFYPFVEKLDPQVICLQETKADQSQATLELPSFQQYWSSADKKGYSGTSIFSKHEPLSVERGFPQSVLAKFPVHVDSFGDPLAEGRVLTVEYETFYLVTVYTPNAKEDLGRLELRHKQWDPAFLAFIKHLELKKPVIFCGDLNVAHTPNDLANPKSNVGKKGFTTQEREGFQNFLDAGFLDTFRLFHEGNGHYTWWSYFPKARERNIGWRIDYFLISKALKSLVTSAAIHPEITGSDHCPISITLAI